MNGIFISYRRADAVSAAGHLFADLTRAFGSTRVFMDIHGGIVAGERFGEVLTDALERCDVLLALVGPRWLSVERDGRRRLDFEDDWVRAEIRRAVERRIPVVPVLLEGMALPGPEALPPDLVDLLAHQSAEITEQRWNEDVRRLIEAIARTVPLPATPPDQVAQARHGLALLGELVSRDPAIREAVSRSREVLETTTRQVERLEVYKTLHDGLHQIEFECLRPMQTTTSANRLMSYRGTFARQSARILDLAERFPMNPALRDDLRDALLIALQAMDAVVAKPSDAGRVEAIAALDSLIAELPPKLDRAVTEAAAGVELSRLAALVSTLGDRVGREAAADDPQLGAFLGSIGALGRLGAELEMRVKEHAQLQGLDEKLRTVCVAGVPGPSLTSEWARIKGVRSRLRPPYLATLEQAMPDLGMIEADIAAAIGAGDMTLAFDQIGTYFHAVASVFRDVDRDLKDFCLRLGEVNEPLKAVLALVQERG